MVRPGARGPAGARTIPALAILGLPGAASACAVCRAQVHAAIHGGGYHRCMVEMLVPTIILAGAILAIALAAGYLRGAR